MKAPKIIKRCVIGLLSATILLTPILIMKAAIATPPSVGAVESGKYRNLFVEAGKSQSEVDAKVNAAFNQLFAGTDNQKVFYTSGSDEAYIYDVGDGDVRSEGMSYGMMICVQMNKQKEFNMLWKWAKNHMYHSSGQFKGFFAWQVSTSGSIMDSTPASDGEEYFATSLLFAEQRWGNGSGIYDYGSEAQALLDAMLHQADDGQGWNMFDKNQNQVVFCPNGDASTFTDPSYHLPGFYEVWAKLAKKDNSTWSKIASTSRSFFQKATNSSTGLGPDYANFDGSPKEVSWSSGHGDFRFDAWRIAGNIAFDYAWWAKDSWAKTHADRIQNFFYNQGMSSYGNNFTISGSKISSDHSPGLIAMNAVASLASTTRATDFVNDFWNTSVPSGQWRYYDGMLYMMGLLHCSGNFKAYGMGTPSSTTPVTTSPVTTVPVTTSVSDVLMGDVTQDGKITTTDVALATRYVLGSTDLTGKPFKAADITGEGKITSTDVALIERYVLGVISSLTSNAPVTTVPPTVTTTVTTTTSINPNAKLLALTFDDGPDTSLTPLVLDKLEKYKVPATFFMIGQKINDSSASVIKRIVSNGYEIGNHSWAWDSLSSMSSDQIKKSVGDTSSAIEKYSGKKPNFFRPPNLATSQTMYDAIDMPFVSGVLAYDWSGAQNTTAESRAQSVINGVQDGSIILMHDVQPLPHPTPEALDILIPTLKDKGYEFVTLTELFTRKGVAISAYDTNLWTTVKK